MARLSYIKQMIEVYLNAKGDKEILSISTCQGGDDEFVLNLADIHEGDIGSNPYTGRDSIHLKRNAAELIRPAGYEPVVPESRATGPNLSMKAFFDLEDEMRRDKMKDMQAKLTVVWGALSVMQRSGSININQVKALWTDFALELMGLE